MLKVNSLAGFGKKRPATGGGGITFVAAGTWAESGSAVTPGLPAGWAENDIFVMFCFSVNSQAITVSGWTEATNSPQDNTAGIRLTVFWKRATSSESDPTTSDSGLGNAARIIALRGCKTTGDPFNVTNGDTTGFGSSTTITVPGVTTTVNNCMVLACGMSPGNGGSTTTYFSSWTNSNLSSVTERIDNESGIIGGAVTTAIGVASGLMVTAGATGNTTATIPFSQRRVHWCGALEPA